MAVPISLRFGRHMIGNVSHFSKIVKPNLRTNSAAVCYSYWFPGSLRKSDRGVSSAATEEKDKAPTDKPDTEKVTKEQLDSLTNDVENLTKQTEELTDKYKRALADGENLRLRLTKQIDDAKLFGIQGFCKDLLEVADILAKATECVPKEEVSDSNPHLKNLYEGLTMTEAQLQKVFRRHGLVPVNPVNEKFDPNLHEALFQQEVEGKEPGTVVVVSKIGYKLHERVIRPALVGVAKA